MIIDRPRQQDLPGLRRIWQEAFGDSDLFLDGFFQTGFAPDQCMCLRIGERPVAALYWFDCHWKDKKIAYLYAIATEKAYRGQGLCRKLMEKTHLQLRSAGYYAATLVPAGEKLFSMYAQMGYRGFCPMTQVEISAGCQPIDLETLTAASYFSHREAYLPTNGICQKEAADYLDRFTQCYRAEDCLACLSREGDTLVFQEFLGNREKIPGILAALNAKTGQLRLPGGDPYGMYLPLEGDIPEDAYLGIPLG